MIWKVHYRICLGYTKISNIFLGMHKMSDIFGGTPSDQTFFRYRADAGAEPMCPEKNQSTPWVTAPALYNIYDIFYLHVIFAFTLKHVFFSLNEIEDPSIKCLQRPHLGSLHCLRVGGL